LAAAKSIWSQRSYFHRDLDAARGDGLVEDLLQSRLDQDRIKFAEDYADIILELTDLKDAYWFRRGVWKKETLPETIYPRQRDHSVHTAHNYLLGWYFFTRCRPITEQLRRSFESRNLEATFEPSFADSFGGLWCFVSLLHDIGYLFEGSVPDEGTAGVDEGIRFGAEYASSYFTNIFWKECKLPRIDDRIIAQRLFGLSTVPIDATSPHSIISYLRDSGAATLGGALGIPDSPAMHSRCGPQIIGISANGKWQREWKISQRRLMLLSIKACRALLSASLIMEYAEDCCYSSILRCGFVCTKHLIERLRPRTLETRMSETNSSRPATGAPLCNSLVAVGGMGDCSCRLA